MEAILISLVILIFSVVVHEVSHGLIAEKLGDDTARNAGRLTLNPIPHIDPFGSILLPALLILIHSPVVFGAAKPVPVDYRKLRSPKRDMALVALAGPGANFLIALVCALPVRFGLFAFDGAGGGFLLQVVVLNIVLGVFNLIPVPPLDGSKVIASFLSDRALIAFLSLERWGFFLIFLFLYTGLLDLIFLPLLHFFTWLFLGVPLF